MTDARFDAATLLAVDGPTLLAIIGMALGAYLTRIGGYWLYRRLRPGESLQAALSYLPGCLFIGFIVPSVANGGPPQWIGALVAALTMLRLRSVVASIFTGTGAAWLVWALG